MAGVQNDHPKAPCCSLGIRVSRALWHVCLLVPQPWKCEQAASVAHESGLLGLPAPIVLSRCIKSLCLHSYEAVFPQVQAAAAGVADVVCQTVSSTTRTGPGLKCHDGCPTCSTAEHLSMDLRLLFTSVPFDMWRVHTKCVAAWTSVKISLLWA